MKKAFRIVAIVLAALFAFTIIYGIIVLVTGI